MIPWDFGLIDAMREKIGCEIYPSELPYQVEKPYLVFEIKDVKYNIDQTARAEINMKVIDNEKPSNYKNELLKILRHMTMEDLILRCENYEIGKAIIKVDRLTTQRNETSFKLIALLKLKKLYEDAEVEDDE